MFRSRILLVIMLALIFAGSIPASGRSKKPSSAPRKNVLATGEVSRGGRFVLAADANHDAVFADELLTGERFRLSGELTFVMAANEETESTHPPIAPTNTFCDSTPLFEQLAELLGQWGMCEVRTDHCRGDLDGDGMVGPADLCRLLSGH